jgi:two-component system NarL family response regulator
MRKSPISLLIIESHALMRSALVTVLAEEPDLDVVAAAADGNEGIALFEQHRPDLALIDLDLPYMDGIKGIERIIAVEPRAKILVITSEEKRERILAALEAGALGYFPKNTARADLIRAVRKAAEGINTICPLILP